MTDQPHQPAPISRKNTDGPRRRGVIAVITREQRLLVIRRSQHVIAPLQLCFPGGGIEPNETEPAALVRELQEELGVSVRPIRRLDESRTPWNIDLAWWRAELLEPFHIVPDPAEVAEVHWLTLEQLDAAPDLLDSNRALIQRWGRRLL